MIKRMIRAIVRRLLRIDRVRWVVEAELPTRRRPSAPPPPADLPSPVFVDRFEVAHPLDSELRGRLKPQWRTMCDPVAMSTPPSDEALAQRATKAGSSIKEAAELIAVSAGRPLSGRILEIGCYDGAAAYQLVLAGATEVVGSDLARYYVVQRPGDPSQADVDVQIGILAELRERAGSVAGVGAGSVVFVEDDITASQLEPGSFDAIVSFEVLEHVQRPGEAFASMARLLKPGGLAYHDYNPFFSINGGHSLCTLDFAWGHARLDAEDFERYLREIRPTEVEQGLRFYRESLNRMTLADVRRTIADAGLELLALVPWTDRKLVPSVTAQVMADVRRNYPSAAPEDLLATFASVVARRPQPVQA